MRKPATRNFLRLILKCFSVSNTAAADNLTLTISRSSQAVVEIINLTVAGNFAEIENNETMLIESSGACIVAQYSKTASADGAESDPMMALVPPVEQYGNFYTFTTPSGVIAPYRNYVNIIMKSELTEGFRLDDAVVNTSLSDHGFNLGDYFNASCWAQDDWQLIGTTGYSARTLAVLHGTHKIYHTNPTVSFNALMYGQVKFESYGFPAGSRLASIGAYCTASSMTVNDGLDNDCDGVIDEELQNGADDDGDGQIDEDCTQSQYFQSSTSNPVTTTSTTATTKSTTTSATTASTTTSPTTKSTTTSATTASTTTSATTKSTTTPATTASTTTSATTKSTTTSATTKSTTAPATTTSTTTSATTKSTTTPGTTASTTTSATIKSSTTSATTRSTTTSTTARSTAALTTTMPMTTKAPSTTQVTSPVTAPSTTITSAFPTTLKTTQQKTTELELESTTIDLALLASINDHQKKNDDDLVVGITVPTALAAAALTTAGCILMMVLKRRRRNRNDEEDGLDCKRRKNKRASIISGSFKDSALPESPTPSTSTTSTYMNESLTTRMMKQKQFSGLSDGYEGGKLSPLDPSYSGDYRKNRLTPQIRW